MDTELFEQILCLIAVFTVVLLALIWAWRNL